VIINNGMRYYDEKLLEELIRDEGYREESYLDTTGHWTIGIGHMLGKSPKFKGLVWPDTQILTTFIRDVNMAIYYTRKYIVVFDQLSPPRKRAMVNMMFNLGPNKFGKFVNTIAAVNKFDYHEAYIEMLDSKWAREDVPNRAKRVSEQWLRG
jgi:GH24 family phage-related lysozyme (muramidase)